MRIVHISTSDLAGGAARSAYRLHRALLEAGVDSRMLVSHKQSADPSVSEAFPRRFSTTRRLLRERLETWPLRFYPRRRTSDFSTNWLRNGAYRAIRAAQPDIVHLHWVNHGFLPIAHLRRLGAPIVWSVLDQWPFTGGCHYSGECTGYERACGRCPLLGSEKETDLSARTWRAKQQAWRGLRIHVVALSEANARQARASALFGALPITVLPPAVDTRVYRPLPMADARHLLDLPDDIFVVAFGATELTNPRKGFDLAHEALATWCQSPSVPRTILCTFGERSAALPDRIGAADVRHVGRLHDDLSLTAVFSAADVVLVPSREDAGPLITTEALACGAPVVGFAIGATVDLVQHRFTGFVARPFAPASLAEGIAWAAAQRGNPALRAAARDVAVRRADTRALVPHLVEIYSRARATPSI